ncbi:MAG: SMC-Scp complex subunit ScpB [Bacteroidota bacterium]
MEFLAQHIESLIFTAERPITFDEIADVLEATFETQFRQGEIEGALSEIAQKYQRDDFAFEMVGIANGYQFLTKGAYFNTVATYLKQTTKKKLSRAALETLSIIAYKQPVSKPEMEKIRGVSCDYALQKLLEKELVTITGRAETVGKPLLYATSEKFMDYFGLKNISDLPKPKDFKTPEETIGEAAPIEEEVPTSTEFKAVLPIHPSGVTEIVGDIMSAVNAVEESEQSATIPENDMDTVASDEEE